MFTYWRCAVEKCPGACKSDNYEGDIEGLVLNKEHNHQPKGKNAVQII